MLGFLLKHGGLNMQSFKNVKPGVASCDLDRSIQAVDGLCLSIFGSLCSLYSIGSVLPAPLWSAVLQ